MGSVGATGEVYDVIIAGAGPVGLFLACELGLAGISVLVLQRDLDPGSLWKAKPLGMRGLNILSIEALYRRGLLSKFFNLNERPPIPSKTPGFQFVGHFAGIMLNGNKLDLNHWKYRLPGPSLVPGATTIERLESVLAERAQSLSVTILRGCGITRIVEHTEKGVMVEAGTNEVFRARWLVGCDGGQSTIRKAAGFEFVGTEAEFTCYIASCDLDYPEKLKPGFNITKTGIYIMRKPNCLYMMDFDGAAFDRTQAITKEHLQSVLERVTGVEDVKITTIHLASLCTDRSKQTTTYRRGRILLAGDAAHIHSPLGAQGLNLGWKLAATVRQQIQSGEAPISMELLDSYENERHPVGAWILEWTRAQVSMLQPNPYGAAMQTLMRDLINTPDGTNLFIDRVWGLSQRYGLGKDEAHAHPLVGCSAPDFELSDGSRLGSKLEGGQGLLLGFEDDPVLSNLLSKGTYKSRVKYSGVDARDRRSLRALLVRPDGTVTWIAEDSATPDMDAAKGALEEWFTSWNPNFF